MKKVYRILFVLSVLFSIVFHTSCDFSIGMGDAPDLEAPKITITSPAPFANVGYNFTLEGTCKDNIGVTGVEIKNNDTGYVYGNASISGENWSFEMHLSADMEGEISLLATASDLAGNISVKSYKQITLKIDETAPNTLSWYIERGRSSTKPLEKEKEYYNGIQTPLYDLQTLKAKNIYLSENKDIPQNQSFAIHGTFYDAMSINEVTVYLKNESGQEIIRKSYSSDSTSENYIGVGNSIFSPVFYFYEPDLIAKDSSLSSGMHYFRIGYVVKDDHGNTSSGDLNWMLWYPESDLPGIYQNQMDIENNTLSVLIDSEVPLDIFDDDGLIEVYYALKNDTIYDTIPGSTLAEKCQSIIDNTTSIRDTIFNIDSANYEVGKSEDNLAGKRDYPISLRTPPAPKNMYLIVCSRDKNNKWNSKIIYTTITDASASMLFISAPKNNEKPTMNAGTNTFTVDGYVLGKNPADSLQMVYIPGSDTSEAKKNRALALLDAPGTIQTGEILRNITLGTPAVYAQNNTLKQQSFKTTYDILTDLSLANSENETSYFFMFRLKCSNNTVQDQIYQLNKDIAKPLLTIDSPSNMKAIDYEQEDLLIKFKAKKDSGLQITNYTVTFNGIDYKPGAGLTQNGDYYQVTIPKATLENMTNPQPVIKFYVKDALGIETEEERTIVLTKLPILNEISTEHASGTYYITGQELLFQAKFSAAVRVIDMTGTNKPQIDIRYSASDTTPKYATYKSGSGTNTLVFSYTVPEGAVSEDLMIKTLDANNTAIKLNETKIKPVAAGEGDAYITTTSLLSGKTIKLDGVAPTVSSFSLAGNGISAGGNTYHKVDGILTITMTASEPVQITGNPQAKMKVGTSDLIFNFNGISSDSKTLTFVHNVSSTSPNGEVTNTQATCFDDTNLECIKDVNGNILKLYTVADVPSGLIIDTVPPAQLKVALLNSSNTEDSRTTTFDYEPTLSIDGSKIESGCTVEYSLDNGVSWNIYNSSSKPILTDGSYKIIARQTDKAGNVSIESTVKNVTVKATFPSISGLVVSTPDGKYKKDSEITFTLSFSEKVNVPASSATLTFAGIKKGDGSNSGVEKTATVVAAADGTNNVTFKYTVGNNDDLQGIKIVAVTFTDDFVDMQNHKVPESVRTAYAKGTLSPVTRNNVVLDSKVPTISKYTPTNGGTSTLGNEQGTFKIELTFDEPVYRESGIITLQRRGQWGIPAVIDGVEFKKIYDKLGNTDQQNLISTNQDGNISADTRDAWTGISIGPYKKITHGIDLETGAPLTDTSFVLDFNLGLFTGNVTLNQHDAVTAGTKSAYNIPASTGKTYYVKDIRKALENYGYHKYEIDISNNSLVTQSTDKKTLTIKLNNDLPAGVEWEVAIPAGALRDAAGNDFAGLSLSTWKANSERNDSDMLTESSYKFWSKGVATPFVRVDRYSHGFGANIPDANGNTTLIDTLTKKVSLEDDIKMTTPPTGYVRVRVDSQTNGSTISYGFREKSSTLATATNNITYSEIKLGDDANYKISFNRSANSNASKSEIEGIGLENTDKANGVIFVVGDGDILTATKSYVRAIASKDGVKSISGYEGVFKTVVYVTKGCKRYFEWDQNNNRGKYFSMNVEGGTFSGGQPSVDGFPFKDAVSDSTFSPYTKNMYKLDNDHNYVFHSYEIVSPDIALLLTGTSHSEDYSNVSYGDMVNVLSCYYYYGDHQGE